MADKTWDAEDPRELPYRFAYIPITQEVLIISMGKVLGFFENRDAFDRFLIEGNKMANLIADPIPSSITEIFPDRHSGGG